MTLATPFETTGTLSDVTATNAFLDALHAVGGRVNVSTYGTSQQGRPLRLIKVGYPTFDAPSKVGIVVICHQHGDEPAPREGALAFARDLLETSDPALIEYLTEFAIWIMPLASPDSYVLWSYDSANGVNLNRDHPTLSIPETQSMAAVLNEAKPAIISDHHERPSGVGRADLASAAPTSLTVEPQIRTRSASLLVDYIKPAVEAESYTYQDYGGAGLDRMRNVGGLRFSMTMLHETLTGPPLAERVEIAQIVMMAQIEAHWENRHAIVTEIAAAKQSAITKGINRNGFQGAPELPAPGPAGYQFSPELWSEVGHRVELLGIEPPLDAVGGPYVTTEQSARSLVHIALHPTSIHAMTTEAVPLSAHPDPAATINRRRGAIAAL